MNKNPSSLIVIDDFYNNPYEVREFALSHNFNSLGNYPGGRSAVHITPETKKAIEEQVMEPIVEWYDCEDNSYGSSFQITIETHESWVHADNHNNWAGVLYLTPDAPLDSGTGFYRSKKDGSYRWTGQDLSGGLYNDRELWEPTMEVGNVFNRLILFHGNLWHSSMRYFGKGLEDGRLTQVFFFNTEGSVINK